MSVKSHEVEHCKDLDFVRGNYYLTAWGMGDAINAVLFLESMSPVPYKILCPPRNFTAIKFLLENFAADNPKCEEVVIYPSQKDYPIPEEEIIMSKHGFGPQNIGMAHQIGKLKVVHFPPSMWHRVQNLEKSGIYQKIVKYDLENKVIDEKTCILFPERGDNYQLGDQFWEEIIKSLKEKGYRIYVNRTDKSDVYQNEKLFKDTEDLNKPNINELFEFVSMHRNLITIGQRSGIFDFLKYFECRKIIFYADIEDPKMEDTSRALFEWCHFTDDIYTKNNIELKLSKYDPKILDLIIQ